MTLALTEREIYQHYLACCSFRASLSADPPNQTEQLLPHTVTLNLPALNNMQHYYQKLYTQTGKSLFI